MRTRSRTMYTGGSQEKVSPTTKSANVKKELAGSSKPPLSRNEHKKAGSSFNYNKVSHGQDDIPVATPWTKFRTENAMSATFWADNRFE